PLRMPLSTSSPPPPSPPRPPLFPYTTLFRSQDQARHPRPQRRLVHREARHQPVLEAGLLDGEVTPRIVHFLAYRRELTLALAQRSEEHTSELQSHLNLVCRLLLEKKKNNRIR